MDRRFVLLIPAAYRTQDQVWVNVEHIVSIAIMDVGLQGWARATVTLDHGGPINVEDPTSVRMLQALLGRVEEEPTEDGDGISARLYRLWRAADAAHYLLTLVRSREVRWDTLGFGEPQLDGVLLRLQDALKDADARRRG